MYVSTTEKYISNAILKTLFEIIWIREWFEKEHNTKVLINFNQNIE